MIKKDKTILIVEDDEQMKDTLSIILKKEGYNILGASNGLEATQRLKESDIDLILLDKKMPKMDGIEFLDKIKPLIEEKKIRVIMITAEEDAGLYSNAIDRGAYDFIPKPFSANEIKSIVATVLGRDDEAIDSSDVTDFWHR